ncbi:glycosyl hydrolase 2 galactose-binding domain-containing protein [Endobacterium cereale]|uniref:glycosyl hydrolase 2 galactose-binding domain-containing protein n=1 Tax=Endobacterium cereale TaxID=2663029 RepID=UPI002B469A4E|nr:glycoside hydrolase family 2 protein [Endobacterium cereale]MEB2845119.1 glycoside hydrolase family 2 protein [Endobacterium cereale]
MSGKRVPGDGWTLILSDAGAYAAPADIRDDAEGIAAPVPGTVASALRDAGQFDAGNPTSLENVDAWYLCDLTEEAGKAVLHFAGLATIAEVYLNDNLILASTSMFEAHDVPAMLTGTDRLAICFRAIGPHINKTGPRARWRPRMMRSQGLRLLRTTALGFMPGWCPDVVAVGPWRPVSIVRADETPSNFAISATLGDDGVGILRVSFAARTPPDNLRLVCSGREVGLSFADGRLHAELVLPDIMPWWPHTHGEPALHDIILRDEQNERVIGRTGFRSITVDRGHDGNDFAIRINGEKVFCRGAIWTNADIVSLAGERTEYEPWLRLAADAGMNMIRIPGVAAYETNEFFKLCDELGIMVWQDLMFANFDYPANDESLWIHVKTEVEQFLTANSASPSLAILCGGSEMFQQGAMMGLPERVWKGSLATDVLAELCKGGRPDVPYVDNSPSGGALPFFPNAGVAHYYGVGAYCRPLSDARRANVRFAAECLAFSNVPDTGTLEKHLPVAPSHDPRWKARVPRDAGASWDFEDVRDHYLQELYGLEPAKLRYQNPERYLAFARAATAEVMEATFAEWRRPGSSCNGALVWTLQDLLPGAGWGVIDATGQPKSAWHALKRAFRPIQVVLSDEGTNGLDVHVINDSPVSRSLHLEVTCLRDGRQVVVSGKRAVVLDARRSITLAATDLLGAFFDTTYAYRFGPPSHDVTVARLKDAEGGDVVAEAFHFPLGHMPALHEATIEAKLSKDRDGAWILQLSSDRLAQSISISVKGFRVAENGFHLAPAFMKQVALLPVARMDPESVPSGSVTFLGTDHVTRF